MTQQMTISDATPSTGDLATSVSAAMLAGTTTLAVLDTASDDWDTRPWSEVHRRAVEVAAQLLADSASQGGEPRAVGLLGDPTIDLVAAIHGAWLAGVAVAILPGPIRGADETRWAAATYARFSDIGVGTVLGGGRQWELLNSVDGGLRVAPAAAYGAGTDTAGFSPRVVAAHAPAVLQGTAGSTGEPKTAVLSRAAVTTNAAELVARLGLSRDNDTAFSWLPLYHDMGLTFLVAAMASGLSASIVPNTAFAAAPFKWLEWLSESGATVTAAPNFAYDIVGRYGRLLPDADLSRVRVAISGGEPIDPDAFDKFLSETARFGFDPAAAAPAYGMAESTCAVTMPGIGEGARYDEVTVTPTEPGSAPIGKRYALLGKPLNGMEIRIVAPEIEVPHIDGRDVGAVEIRGTSMMNGYLGQPEIGTDQWFATGDLGYLVDGRLVICGRAKEVVIVAGRNLFPVEVERAAAGVSGVRRGGVVAMARNESARRPGLVVVAEYRGDDRDGARAEVISAVASECGIVPAEVIFVAPGSVPRTTSGKLRRLETAQLVASGGLS